MLNFPRGDASAGVNNFTLAGKVRTAMCIN
jgi:hypothetical protein